MADEYNLGDLPRLVYYRHKTPIIYESEHCQEKAKNILLTFAKFSSFLIDELSREEDVLEWLIENKSTGDDEDVIEEVTAKTLGTLINNIDNLVVVFCELNFIPFQNKIDFVNLRHYQMCDCKHC